MMRLRRDECWITTQNSKESGNYYLDMRMREWKIEMINKHLNIIYSDDKSVNKFIILNEYTQHSDRVFFISNFSNEEKRTLSLDEIKMKAMMAYSKMFNMRLMLFDDLLSLTVAIFCRHTLFSYLWICVIEKCQSQSSKQWCGEEDWKLKCRKCNFCCDFFVLMRFHNINLMFLIPHITFFDVSDTCASIRRIKSRVFVLLVRWTPFGRITNAFEAIERNS